MDTDICICTVVWFVQYARYVRYVWYVRHISWIMVRMVRYVWYVRLLGHCVFRKYVARLFSKQKMHLFIKIMTPARDPKQILFYLGGGSWEKATGRGHLRRHLGGCIWEETSEERHLGRGIWENSGKTWHHLGSPGITQDHLGSSIWNHLG